MRISVPARLRIDDCSICVVLIKRGIERARNSWVICICCIPERLEVINTLQGTFVDAELLDGVGKFNFSRDLPSKLPNNRVSPSDGTSRSAWDDACVCSCSDVSIYPFALTLLDFLCYCPLAYQQFSTGLLGPGHAQVWEFSCAVAARNSWQEEEGRLQHRGHGHRLHARSESRNGIQCSATKLRCTSGDAIDKTSAIRVAGEGAVSYFAVRKCTAYVREIAVIKPPKQRCSSQPVGLRGAGSTSRKGARHRGKNGPLPSTRS